MTKTHNTIVLNGKHYDVMTGKPVALPTSSATKQPKNIDGIVRGSTPAKVAPQPKKAITAPVAKQPVPKKARHAAQHAALPKPHASKTLMRQVVKKPTGHLHVAALKAQTPTDIVAVDAAPMVAPKLSSNAVDSHREARAKHVAKSKLISRFGEVKVPASLRIDPAVVPVASAYVTRPAALLAAQQVSGQRSMDIFQKAVEHATSHQEPKIKRAAHSRSTKRRSSRSHRLASVGSTAIAVVALAGFLAYQNVANVKVHLAAARAGFAATLPGYKPSGFSVGRFAYSPGNVTINFHSNSDTRHFALIEQPSNWDSSTLLNDYVASATQNYQTVETAGRTLYIYGQSSATWVNGGVWYRVDGQNSLSTTQLINLASSM